MTGFLVHLKEIVILRWAKYDHIASYQPVLTQVSGTGLTLEPKKCQFAPTALIISVKSFSLGGLEVSTRTTNAITQISTTHNSDENSAFLGGFMFSTPFCLTSLLWLPNWTKSEGECKSHTFDWLAEDKVNALLTMKARLVEATGLALPHSWKDYNVGTQACHKKIRCVALQKQPNGSGSQIVFWSSLLNDDEI